MRPERRLILGAIVALGVGVIAAKPYARLAAPYYQRVAEWVAEGRPWEIERVEVVPSPSGLGAVLRLTGEVSKYVAAVKPSARLVSKLQVAAVIESPAIFWTTLLIWPAASQRQRLLRAFAGIPIFLGLEAGTTVCQLLSPLAYASATVASEHPTVTSWELWSRFLEGGGRIALALVAATLTASIVTPRRSKSDQA